MIGWLCEEYNTNLEIGEMGNGIGLAEVCEQRLGHLRCFRTRNVTSDRVDGRAGIRQYLRVFDLAARRWYEMKKNG